jgi:hypothetical protein
VIWLTWRQHRRQLLATLAGLVALAAVLVPTGLTMRNTYDDLGLAACLGPGTAPDSCDQAFNKFSDSYGSLVFLGVLLLALPLLMGLFWGAPVVAREVEQGTHRMIWTQGISRRRWALTKIGLLGGVVTLLAAGYGLGTAWWFAPLSSVDSDQSRFASLFFDMQGVAPIGYTVFAVALGIAAGTALPRTLSAMAVTLGGFIGVRVAVEVLARPHFRPAEALKFPISGGPGHGTLTEAGSWMLSTGVYQADGTKATNGLIRCKAIGDGVCGADDEFGLRPGAYNMVTYQPADRFWLFQWLETGLFVVLAALLILWAVRRLNRLT